MRIIFIISLVSCLLLTSCHSSKQLIQAKNQREQLSRKLGFKITKKDNLQLYSEAVQWLGTPYRYGGTTRKGIDCSGLINQIYRQVYHKELSRSSQDIADKNCKKVAKGNLKAGNLVFFNTSRKKKKGINHVGLFLKDGHFIHASTSKGVIISNLKEDYYKNTWKQGGKVR